MNSAPILREVLRELRTDRLILRSVHKKGMANSFTKQSLRHLNNSELGLYRYRGQCLNLQLLLQKRSAGKVQLHSSNALLSYTLRSMNRVLWLQSRACMRSTGQFQSLRLDTGAELIVSVKVLQRKPLPNLYATHLKDLVPIASKR